MAEQLRRLRRGRALVAVALLLLAASLSGAAPALAENAEAPWWRVSATAAPTNLPPGGEGQIGVSAINVGDGEANASSNPVTITDNLPTGFEATNATGQAGTLLPESSLDFRPGLVKCTVTAKKVTCAFEGPKTLFPFVPLEVEITVKVPVSAESGVQNEILVAGGGAPSVTQRRPLTVSSAPTPFGLQNVEFAAESEGGSPDTQAGSHPFQVTTVVAMNQTLVANPLEAQAEAFPKLPISVAQTKDVIVKLPPGLVGNVTVLPQCSESDFTQAVGFRNACPAATAVGVASATLFEPEVPPIGAAGGVATATVPVFNLVPAKGEPARFGFDAYNNFVTLDTSVATGENYAVATSVSNITEIASLLSSEVTLWGVPADARHDRSRGWGCLAGAPKPFPPCASLSQPKPPAFLSLPGSCREPLHAIVESDSWKEPGSRLLGEQADLSDPRWQVGVSEVPALEGCSQLPFTPSISIQPETQAGSTPTGLKVDVHVPQEASASAAGLAEATVKDTTVTLPAGVQLNPAAAHGLLACSESEIGFIGVKELYPAFEEGKANTDVFTPTLGEQFCPEAAKIGTVRVKTPLLPNELTGGVYIAAQEANPFNSLVAAYIVAEDPVSGVIVKLAGNVRLNPETGQIVSTFENAPQTPFEDFVVNFFTGPTGAVSTPAYCGTYTSTASFTTWAGIKPVESSSSFPITSNCTQPGSAQPFAPTFQAGVVNAQAGAFSPFSLTITNPDGDQSLVGLREMHLPPGLAAVLASVTPCQEPAVKNNECGPESVVGHSVASAGLGTDPYELPGTVFLTGPYDSPFNNPTNHVSPFGLSVVTPAVAGPFNLGDVTVRSTIDVNPETAAVTITSDPFPIYAEKEGKSTGIPAQLKKIHVITDRPGFQFNPTNCKPMSVGVTMTGSQGGVEAASSPFQVANCASLAFHPTLTAATFAQASKNNGAALNVKVTSAGLGVANIEKVFLTIPRVLPSRLSTIQKACDESIFDVNPATCDEGSVIGKATIHTPVFKNPLVGPAYLVSHGGRAFPDVEFVLQGEGVTVVLDGKTDIKNGVTYSRFESSPDAPFTTFETELPTGPHSALTAYVPLSKKYNLCGANLNMPTEIYAQNGAVIKETTKIAIKGCAPTKKSKAKHKTNAKKLAAALKACSKLGKGKRATCAKTARRRFPVKAAKRNNSANRKNSGRR
jgi:hypothetical protein